MSERSEPPSLLGRVGIGLFLLVLVLAPAIGGFPAGGAYSADTALAALHCLTIVSALALLLIPGRQNKLCPTRIAVWAVVGWTVLSLLVHSKFLTSPVLLFAMLPATLDWLCYGLVFAIAASLGRDRKQALWIAGALVVGGAWAAVCGAREYGQFVQAGMPGQRAQAPFLSANFLAGFLGLTLPIAAALFLAMRERLAVLGLGAVTALMAGTLVATGSRAGVALTVGGLGVALLLAVIREKGKLPWLRIGGLLAAIVVLGFAFSGPLLARSEGGGQEHSGAFRTWTWKGTMAMAQANPFLGTGPGTFPYLYPKYALVARTDLAHSSYLQVAAEQGFPALVLVVIALLLALGNGVAVALRKPDAGAMDDGISHLLLCGLIGGVLVGAARSVFDSEWSLLGNGIPLFAAVGLLRGLKPYRIADADPPEKAPALEPVKLAIGFGLLIALVFSILVLRAAVARDGAQAKMMQGEQPESVWPPDSQLLAWQKKMDESVQIEPTGKRYFQLGRSYEREGKTAEAIAAFKESLKADPNTLQTWRKLAEMQEGSGDTQGALESWRELVKRDEGVVGQNRAIPELREIHSAYAYASLAKDAATRNKAEAISLYEKAAAVIEEYSKTTPIYQQMEIAMAAASGTDIQTRREEIRSLYENIIREWSALDPTQASTLTQRRDETFARFDKFIPLTQPGTAAP